MTEAHAPRAKIVDFGPKVRTLAKVFIAALIRIAVRGTDSESLPPGFQQCRWESGNQSIAVQVNTWGSVIRYIRSQSYMGYPEESLPSKRRIDKAFLPALKALDQLQLASISDIRKIKDFGRSTEGISFKLINLPSWDSDDCAQEIERRYQTYLKGIKDSNNAPDTNTDNSESRVSSPSSVPQAFSISTQLNVERHPPCYAPWPTAKTYIGREHTLVNLHNSLTDLPEGRALSITAIGGEGKTELCRQYARRYLKHYRGGVFWVADQPSSNFRQPQHDDVDLAEENARQRLKTKLSIANKIIAMAIDTGCPIEPLTPAERYSEELLMLKLKRVWGLWQQEDSLFVYDNLISLERDLLPPPDDPRFKVLLTTRINALGTSVVDFPLQPISDQAAVELLRIHIDEARYLKEKSYAESLVAFADKLPLGIELIGGYLDEPLNRLKSFEEVFKRLCEKRTDWSVIRDVVFDSPLSDEQQNISECYDISWTQLSSAEKEAAYLIASNTTHTAIDTDFLYAQIRNDEDSDYSNESTSRTFNRLIKYNLIKHTANNRQNYVSYHLLLRDFVRFQMPEDVREFLSTFWA